ncbi:carbamoyltransferase HypF [Enterobacteriaceae bacterium YMB-R22]|jgi:hydrogenase maturation protein HypF|uniref:carbamoyltransferase HypF n=1 Tax=Tenebrionicola larvae TaxID=2815733 RepID=UPI002010EA73|nr:carbamoyltransferase HypF [Tenebrionicola larvae]MBV4413683.1 carbamoyltransferase HypF [Tenebrionicola larvae]
MRLTGTEIRICGKVQGVGLRPFVWQLACQLGLRGCVFNDGAGVIIRLAGSATALLAKLKADCPPLARIDSVETRPWTWRQTPADFRIIETDRSAMTTHIAPDAATCPDCLREINDPNDRRYRYPFNNCTHCGPRLTIIRAMPYDRPATAMNDFPLCANCAREYRNPADRRFHAQPVACPHCGPQIRWRDADGRYAEREAALQAAATALCCGLIVAIKGLGGFHLACDATCEAAVQRLRLRKHRLTKPLAVMLPDTGALSAPVAALLSTPAAPIVLEEKRRLPALCAGIAPGLNQVGVMLPSTPLHHLLIQATGRPLVMTSGNASGRPPALDNDEALADLAGIADGWLIHNRPVLQRMDDSVLQRDGRIVRRARGFVPDALALPPDFLPAPPTLCVGADQKNTLCLLRGRHAVLSQHLGDLNDEAALAQWRQTRNRLCALYDFQPHQAVADAHPGYLSVRLAQESGLPIMRVQHHHAHAAACLAEHGWPSGNGPVIALILDGTGWGDGRLWGGECLKVDYRHYQHLGGLPAVALPGGEQAIRQPWRNLLAQLHAWVPGWQQLPEASGLLTQPWQPLLNACERGINSPLASSCGRLFDAIAAALGCAPAQLSYEGEAACLLQALAERSGPVAHPVTLALCDGKLDLAGFWHQWLNWRAEPGARAWAFHDALARGLAQLARYHARRCALDTVVCTGGVMHNSLLRLRLARWLGDLRCLFPAQLPAGDGAIAFGQAVIAAAHFSLLQDKS